MSAVYFEAISDDQYLFIAKDKKNTKVLHINWSYWYEECLDNENKQIKIHIHQEGPYLFSNKFSLTFKVKFSTGSTIKEEFFMDNVGNPQVFTINLLECSAPVGSVWGYLNILNAGCITNKLKLYHDFGKSDRPHDVVLNFADGKLYCNKVVLALWFNYFDRIFFSETANKDIKEFDLSELESTEVECLLELCFFSQEEFPRKSENLTKHWNVEELKTVCFLEMSLVVNMLKEHAAMVVCLSQQQQDWPEELMVSLELAEKHNFSHVQDSVVRLFRERFDTTEKKKKFITEYEHRLKQLKLKNMLNFIEKGFEFESKKPDCTFAFSVEEQSEEAKIYEKEVNNYKNVTLLIGDQQFKVHKEYLAFWSPYFDRLFFGDFAEKGRNEIEMKEIDPEEFSILLKMIYPPRNTRINDSNVLLLLKLSDRLGMKIIMTLCGNYMASSIKNGSSTIHLMDLLEISDTHNLIDVQIACFNKIKQMKTEESEKFRSENCLRLAKLSPLMISNVFQAI